MKQVTIMGPRQAYVEEVEEPAAQGPFAKVQVEVAPMCTEYKAYRDGVTGRSLGHEAAGTVVETDRIGPVRAGDRVVVMPTYPCGACRFCRSGAYIHCLHNRKPLVNGDSQIGTATYAEYLLKNDWLLLPVPDGMSLLHASMACCGLGPTFGAMQFMQVGRFDTVLILGLGPVGLGGVINGVYRGARVVAVEGNAYRAELGRRLGARHVLDPHQPDVLDKISKLTEEVGVDKAIDCTGVPEAQRLAIEATRRLGTVCLVGEGGEVPIRTSADMIRKGLTIRGIWHWNLTDAEQMFRTIADTKDMLDMMITHTFPLEKVEEAYRLQLSGECGKVVLLP